MRSPLVTCLTTASPPPPPPPPPPPTPSPPPPRSCPSLPCFPPFLLLLNFGVCGGWGVKVKLDDGCSLVCVRCFSPFSFFRFGKLQGSKGPTEPNEASLLAGSKIDQLPLFVCSDRWRRAFGAFAVPAPARPVILSSTRFTFQNNGSFIPFLPQYRTTFFVSVERAESEMRCKDRGGDAQQEHTPPAPATDDGTASLRDSVSLSPRLEEAHFPLAA